jgi:hypothetical protein
MFKPLLNNPEKKSFERLREVCSRNSAHVFAKVRVADVLPIENSGISDELFRFALQSHFDFVIADEQHVPLFTVEFDGPTHLQETQVKRDVKKQALCLQFNLPLLRIDARYLERRYDKQDLLTRFVEVWFSQRNYQTALAEGLVCSEEGFDPSIWVLMEPRQELAKLYSTGKCIEEKVPHLVGEAQDGHYDAIGCIRISEQSVAWASARMRAQQFPVRVDDVLEELIFIQTVEELKAVANGTSTPIPLSDFHYHMDVFLKEHRIWSSAWINSINGQITWLKIV